MEDKKRLSLQQCKKILEDGGGQYSDEQVRLIRDTLYTFGELDHAIFKDMQRHTTDQKHPDSETVQ